MRSRSLFFASLSLSFFLLVTQPAQPGPSEVKPGDILPPLAGQSLTGKWLYIASATSGKPAVVVFSFSRAGGRDAQLWTQHLEKDNPHLPVYTIIFLEMVPGLFRTLAVSRIKAGMPPALQDRTILLYQDENLWKHRLQVANDHYACVILLGSAGPVRWMTPGPFADSLYAEFSKTSRTLH